MEGSIRDVGSHGTGARRCRILLGNLLRNRLGERYLSPVAPGLFAVLFLKNHSFGEFSRTVRFVKAIFFKRPGIIFFAILMLFCPVDKVSAVPICDSDFGYAWYGIESSRADWDMYGYNLVGQSYTGPVCGGFSEGDNIEWMYNALENQYTFLDDTIYRITGGCYLLGSVCYPLWHGFRYYWIVDPDREIIYFSGNSTYITAASMDNIEYDDMATFTAMNIGTGRGDSLVCLRKLPRLNYPTDEYVAETKAVPELSTFTLFGLAVLQLLRQRRIGRDKRA
jgi:hypothetical protein